MALPPPSHKVPSGLGYASLSKLTPAGTAGMLGKGHLLATLSRQQLTAMQTKQAQAWQVSPTSLNTQHSRDRPSLA